MSFQTLEAQRAHAKSWREKNREAIRAYAAKWRADHRQQINDAHGEWRRAHPDKIAAWRKAWKDGNPERVKRIDRRYKKRERERNRLLILSLPCLECGMFHTPEARQRVIRRMLPCEAIEIHEAWPCFFGEGGKANKSSAGTQQLYRDLKAIGAVRTGQTWHANEQRAIA